MVIDVVVGFRWWCPCGWVSPPGERGAAQLTREHSQGCSYPHRFGGGINQFWAQGMSVRWVITDAIGGYRQWRVW